MGLWSDRSNAVIRHVLESLPVGATEAECRKALRERYPFGQRKHHPYSCWLKCCREALDKRFAHKAKPTEVFYRISRRVNAPNRPWLEVYCGWCADLKYRNGCLSCGGMRTALATVVDDPQFRGLAQAANDDDVAVLALLDFCEEKLGVRPRTTLKKVTSHA